MARRSDHSRDELREMALQAARDITAREGLRGLTARGVARRIGYTIGTMYNLFDDLDDLTIQMNGRTLDTLYEILSKINLDSEPEAAVRALADGYTAFVSDNAMLWAALFEHRLPGGPGQLPDWHYEKVWRLLGLVEQTLAPLFGPGEEADRHHTARVFWSSLHGICSLESSNKLPVHESVEGMAETLITCFLAGLRRQQAAGRT